MLVQYIAAPGGFMAALIYGGVSGPEHHDGFYIVAFATDGLLYSAFAFLFLEFFVRRRTCRSHSEDKRRTSIADS